jgi:hypothetical protein
LAQTGGIFDSVQGGGGSGGASKRIASLSLRDFQIQDYVWQRLVVSVCTHQIGTENSPTPFQYQYRVRDLSDVMIGHGATHFSPNHERPLLYFQVLMLCQEYEVALDYLAAQHRTIDAVHFALVLHYYGLLRLHSDTAAPSDQSAPSPRHQPFSSSFHTPNTYGLCDPETRSFKFSDLLDGYVQTFSRYWPGRAADYYAMLENKDGIHQERKDHIVRLILQTRSHNLLTLLVGSSHDDHRSILNDLLEEREYEDCMELAAQKAQAQGEGEIAVTLYHRCKKYTHALVQMNVLLASSLRPTTLKERRERTERMARQFAGDLSNVQPARNDNVVLYQQQMKTLKRLLNMAFFFRKMEEQDWVQAQEAAALSRVVNVDLSGSGTQQNIQETIRHSFNGLDNAVKSNVGLFLTEYLRCLYELFQQNVAGQPPGDTLRRRLLEIKRRADIVFQHAVCIQGQQYQFSSDDQNKLMKYLSLMKL